MANDCLSLRVEQSIEHPDYVNTLEAVRAFGKSAQIGRPEDGGDFLAGAPPNLPSKYFGSGLRSEISSKNAAGNATMVAEVGQESQSL